MHGMQVRTTAQSTAMHEAHPAHDGADMPTLMPALVHCMQFCVDDIMHTHGHPAILHYLQYGCRLSVLCV